MRKGIGIFILVLVLTAAAASLNAAAVDESGRGISIGETPFIPRLVNPLCRLDLIPDVGAAPSPALNLDPRNVVLGPSRSFSAPRAPRKGIGDGLFEASAISLLALNVADYFSTREALRYPGLREGNPLLKSVVQDPAGFAAVKIGFAAASYISLKSFYKKNRALGWAASVLSNFALSYVVANNIRQINIARSRQCAF
jgi:hypothetical protein